MPIEIVFCSFDYRIARIRIFLCRLKLIRSEWICICVSDSMHSSDCLPIKWLKSSKMCVYLSLLSFLHSFSLPQCLCMLHIWIDMRKCGKRVHEKCILGKCFFGRAGLPLFMCIEEIKCAIIPRNCTRPNPKIIMALVQSLGCGYTTATTHTHTNLEWETTSVQMHSRKKCTKWHSNRTYSHIIQNSFYLSHACHQITHIPCNILVVCTHTTHTTHTLEWSNRARLGGLFGRLTRHKSIGSVLWDSRLLWDEWQLLSQNVQLTAFCTPLLKPIHFVNIINSSYERKIHITRTNRITIFHSVYPKIG